jgi:hypothetical protein
MKWVKIISILTIVVIFSGCVSHSNQLNSQKVASLEIYFRIEEKNAIFEIKELKFRIAELKLGENEVEVINQTIEEFGIPIKIGEIKNVQSGKKSISFAIEGEIVNQYDRKIKVREFLFKSFDVEGDKLLINLEIYKEEESFRIKISEKSGVVGKDVPNAVFLDNEVVLLLRAMRVSDSMYKALERELAKNHEVRVKLLKEYKDTGNYDYLQSYRDSFYIVRAFAELGRWKDLDETDFKALLMTLKANNAYYSYYTSPKKDFYPILFSESSPYYSTFLIDDEFKSELPFIYYKGRGFNLYPVTSIHWAELYFQRGKNRKALQILDELKEYIHYGDFNGTKYALFLNYFHFENSSIPWVSGYAQGMGAGLYAKAYQITGNKTYLEIAKLLINSFKLPLDNNGFVSKTKYGSWYLEYNYNPNELVLNGHIIALQGIYYYWEVTGDKYAWNLFQDGVESTKKALPIFDTGDWSKYSNIHGKASEGYHRLHIQLLKWLYEKTGDEYFLEYAKKWNQYLIDRGLRPEKIS